jgi:hypothetical protein
MSTTAAKKRRLPLAPALLLAAVAGLAISASGCVIDDGVNHCQPFLTVPWQIVVVDSNGNDVPTTCSAAGATSVEIDVNGIPYTQTCPPAATGGSIDILLGGSGSYTVDAFLLEGNTTRSEAHPPSFGVGCIDTQTPTVVFPVNLQ